MTLYYPFIREPAVAGTFYPADPDTLRDEVDGYLAAGADTVETGPAPRAIIGPHAGYRFSGPVAGSAYARLVGRAEGIERVVLVGPSHRVAFPGIATSSAEAFDTPLGRVPVERTVSGRLAADVDAVRELDQAHAQEHGLEVHLPFLQRVVGDFQLIPLVVGRATGAQVAETLAACPDDDATLLVISSDLSHYQDYETARQLDAGTSEAIRTKQVETITPPRACGALPIQGLLHLSGARGLADPEILDVRSSGDTAGPKDRVVGYGAYVLA